MQTPEHKMRERCSSANPVGDSRWPQARGIENDGGLQRGALLRLDSSNGRLSAEV